MAFLNFSLLFAGEKVFRWLSPTTKPTLKIQLSMSCTEIILLWLLFYDSIGVLEGRMNCEMHFCAVVLVGVELFPF
jgi:hypothetical protein